MDATERDAIHERYRLGLCVCCGKSRAAALGALRRGD